MAPFPCCRIGDDVCPPLQQGLSLWYNMSVSSQSGGFYSFVTDDQEFIRWEGGANNVSTYTSVSCEVRPPGQSIQYGPFKLCSLDPSEVLSDANAVMPFHLVLQAADPDVTIDVHIRLSGSTRVAA